jgi:hypothetical protein
VTSTIHVAHGCGIEGGCFTDVVLRSSINYHQEHTTESRGLSKDVAAACGTNFAFPRSFEFVHVLLCELCSQLSTKSSGLSRHSKRIRPREPSRTDGQNLRSRLAGRVDTECAIIDLPRMIRRKLIHECNHVCMCMCMWFVVYRKWSKDLLI